MAHRFKDDGRAIYAFEDNFLVHCPRCDKQTTMFNVTSQTSTRAVFRRIACGQCGFTKDYSVNSAGYTPRPTTHPLEIVLWLEMSCCGETLWVYNLEHLDFLENFVRAEIRESNLGALRQSNPSTYVNKTLASRLPQWIKSARNREEILRCIEKLKKTLE